MGIKLGGGLGTALFGWLLSFGGYENGAAVQSASAIGMMQVMYIVIPAVICILMLAVIWGLDVQKGMERLKN